MDMKVVSFFSNLHLFRTQHFVEISTRVTISQPNLSTTCDYGKHENCIIR